jgi:hypothetical protein
MVVAADWVAVDFVVATHDRAGLRALDRDLEREQVGLAVRGGVDDRVQPVAIGLVVVERIVLERRDDALALDAVDGLGAEDSAEQRIFGVVLEVPAVPHVALKVNAAAQQHVESSHPRLTPEHGAPLARQRRIEARANDDRRRQCRGSLVVGPVAGVRDTEAGIGRLHSWHPQTRHAGRIARAHGNALRDAPVAHREDGIGAHHADKHRETLVVGQLLLGFERSRIG